MFKNLWKVIRKRQSVLTVISCSHAGFKTHNRRPTVIKIERATRRKYLWSTKPRPLYSKAFVSTTTHCRWPTSTEIERTAQRKHHWTTKPGPLYSKAIVWTICHPQRYVQLGSTNEANCTSTASDTITLMNYTISSHSKINSKINFALKIIFKLNFRVS